MLVSGDGGPKNTSPFPRPEMGIHFGRAFSEIPLSRNSRSKTDFLKLAEKSATPLYVRGTAQDHCWEEWCDDVPGKNRPFISRPYALRKMTIPRVARGNIPSYEESLTRILLPNRTQDVATVLARDLIMLGGYTAKIRGF